MQCLKRPFSRFIFQIKKRSDILCQNTLSNIKNILTCSNTLKYLKGCTPDGLISFISSGYGGRISDTNLFQGMEILPEKSCVMADRGFEQIQTILNQKGCRFFCPPSVSASSKCTKQDVLETKRIASLRIHVERVIQIVREFKILEPHSCLDCKLLPHINDMVHIASALINLQKPIIKK